MKKIIRTILRICNFDLIKRYPRPMITFLSKLKKENLVGVEIGTFEGEHALSIIKELEIKKLYLIDPYMEYKGYDEPDCTADLKKSCQKARNRLDDYEETQFIFKRSEEAVKDIVESIDFIYIDGNHDYEYVKKDIELYWPLVKEKGMMGGHDFDMGYNFSQRGVIKAVTEFVEKHKLKLYVRFSDWWIIKPKLIK